MAVNLPKIADTPYLSLYCNSTKQNDNVTMTFPVNSSQILQIWSHEILWLIYIQKITQKRKNSQESMG